MFSVVSDTLLLHFKFFSRKNRHADRLFLKVLKAAKQKTVIRPSMYIPKERLAAYLILRKDREFAFVFFKKVSLVRWKPNFFMADSVFSNDPEGVVPLNDDTNEIFRRKFPKN